MTNLMIFQLITQGIAFLLVLFLFWDAPPTSPSHSEQLKRKEEKVALDSEESQDIIREEEKSPRTRKDDMHALLRDLQLLSSNRDYMVLMLCFALGVGLFNALITVLNQFVQPLGYSNTASGLFGAVFILGGLLGAIGMGMLLLRLRFLFL